MENLEICIDRVLLLRNLVKICVRFCFAEVRATGNYILSVANPEQCSWLIVYENKLKRLPDSITTLTNLVVLNLNSNFLTEIPEILANLVKLEDISAATNKISWVSPSITSLTNLIALDLRRNDLPGGLNLRREKKDDTQMFLKRISDLFKKRENARKLALFLIHSRKYRKSSCGILAIINLDSVKLISKYVYATRNEKCWIE